MSAIDEPDLARFLKKRDEASFLRLYEAHTPVLFRVALRLLDGRPSDAEDAVQETWTRAVERIAEFRGESKLRTWLTSIVINCCRELRRRGLPKGGEPQEAAAGGPPEPEALDLIRAINLLPEGYREVLVLHDVEGYTHREIAGLLGIADGTSKSQLFLARRALRRAYAAAASQGDET